MNQSFLRKMVVARLGLFSLAAVFYLAASAAASAANLVQEFYLPMPEAQIYTALNTITPGISTAQSSIYSIIVTGNGTVIYYDQWEDGYETDLGNPTQASTRIWGDGNDAHGIPPGFTHNPLGLPAGTVITLTNAVALPRNPATLLFDGRDRIAATKALVVSHAGWPVSPGPVFGGAVSVLSTIDYGTNYVSPVGQDMTTINLFKYVGLFVMASQNGTLVTIDPDGPGPAVATNIVLNQGESFFYNGGIKTGASVVASKPVQAHLMIGHVGNSYAADWFTLYPVQAWSSAYYTPVGSAVSGSQPAYVYLYNSNPTNITINYKSLVGSGSFSVPASNGVYQFQMPIGSGASFISSGGANFYALCTVAANNSADTAYNWGFTLLPAAGLTTEADVGWAPGSSDNSVDGNPVWVTPLAATRIYVDYKGDHLGSLIDPNGNRYDTNFDLAPLQSQKIYDPSKDQTAMRVYTLSGTPISVAWGEDADVAAPGLPYIDAGTTVLPFPVPVLKKTSINLTHTNGATALGDTLLYTVEIDNKGLLPLGNVVVIDIGPTNLAYVTNTTLLNGTSIPDNVGTNNFPLANPGYTIPVILRAGTSIFQYQAKIVGAGSIVNTVNVGGTSLYAQNSLSTATNSSSIAFTLASGSPIGSYAVGTNLFVQLTDPGANTSSNSIQTLVVVVNDTNTGDFETITLVETGTNTGVFLNTNGLPTSTFAGVLGLDGTLHVAVGDTLTVNFTDPTYGNSCSNSATITGPQLNKILYLTANGANGVQALNRVNPAATAGHGTNYTSVDLGTSGGSGVVVFDSASSNKTTGTLTWSHFTTNAANRLMLVGLTYIAGSGNAATSITYGGAALTKVRGVTNVSAQSEVWQLVNPPAGSNTVTVTKAGSGRFYAGAATFSGVATSSPLSATNSATNTVLAATITIPSAVGEIVFDNLASDNLQPTNGPGQTQLWNLNNAAAEGGAACTKAGTNSVTISWSAGNPWAQIAVSVKPAAGGGSGGGTNMTTFTQTPAFALPFTIASNQTISVTTYITVTNGTVIGNTNLTATLQANGTNFITLTNLVYTQNAGVNSNLVWSGTLSTNVTIPTNQVISCVFSNSQSGVTFHINYDTTNQPSQISLPAVNVAGNVIHITGLGVYDAPYPGGNLVNAPVAGAKLYVRVTATDPFGSYDISSVNFAITGPGTNANVIATVASASFTNASSATFEYVWQTGTTTGAYNVSATANEGSEGITDTAGTSLTLAFLDLGTPSTTEFTSGNNGPATNNYIANSTVWMRVTDLNRNTNATTVDLITVIVTSNAGGSNSVTFTETGTNTGVFTGFVITSTNGSGGLLAPVGSQLTVSYTDPTDLTDHTLATAIIVPAPGIPGVAVNKTIVSPANGRALINNLVQFYLQVINTGSTTLTNVSLVDNFPAGNLSFQTASLPPTSTNASSLVWTNLGTLTPGQSTNISVSFNAIASAAVTNNAVVSSGATTNNTGVPFTIANPAVTVTKTLLSPTNSPVSISSNVVFRIIVQNTGNTLIPMLPMEDSFSAAYLQFVSATIPPNGSGAGSLIWTNLASPTPLAINASITNDITMLVVGAGSPARNDATVDYAVDSSGNDVPVSSSTSTNLVTAAASINGHIYNDLNHSGVFTNGDTGLSSVALSLYTDPSGTGVPGALVQLVATDANGYYEFLNLTPGHYVVVQTTLPGYVTSSPVNNRLPLNLTSLTPSANNNFFQYQPNPAVYGNISGTVYYDANGNGTNDLGETNLANVTIDLVQDANTNGLADPGEPVVAGTTTDTNGNYTFLNATPGNYVVRQTLLYGDYSTGDSSPPNNNQIPIALTAGLTTTNNNFYDRLLPTAVNDSNSGPRNVPVIINPLVNDLSPNGDPLIITNAATANGLVVINAGNTNLTYTPASLGVATISYTISDGHGGTSTAVITVTVTNLAPVAVNDTVATPINVPVTISALTNDFDPNGDPLVITLVTPTNGIASIVNGTNVLFTPTANFTGAATIGYTISDGNGGTASAVITVNVFASADVSVSKVGPAGIIFGTNFDYTITVSNAGPSTATALSVTDSLPVGLVFVSSIPAAMTNGINQVIWSVFGDLAANTSTNLSLKVISTTRGMVTNVAMVGSPVSDPTPTNNVTPPVVTSVTNNPPVANPDNYVISEKTTNTFSPLTNDVVQTPGGNLTIISVNPTNGTATISGTNVIFTPTLNFVGTATIGYTITDNVGGTNSSVITVTVTNLPPTAFGQAMATMENTAQAITLAGSDPTSLPLTFIIVTGPANGTLTAINTNTGVVTYTPNANYLGADAFTFRVNNGYSSSPAATVSLMVTNIPPVANPDSYAVGENSTNTLSPLVNDLLRTPGGNLALVSVNPTNGTATISGTNVGFTPANNFIGVATIGYTITDNVGGTNSSVITITVTNMPPVANPDFYGIGENSGTNTFSPLVNDVVQTSGGSLLIMVVSPTNGTASISGTNVLFVPATNFLGNATIGYTITDNIGGTNTGLITVAVTNRPPVAVNDVASTPKNVAVTIPVLANDSDPDFNPLTLVSVSPTNGAAIIAGTNVVFTPATNFLGTAIVGYSITDGNGGTNSALIFIAVTNRPPVAVNDFAATPENVAVMIPVLVNDSDPDGDALTIISVSPTSGLASIAGTNVNFTPTNNFIGTTFVGYTIADGFGGTSTALVHVTVTNVPPVANPDNYTVAENSTNMFSPLLNDLVLTPGGGLTLIGVNPTNGTASIAGTNVIFTPTLNFIGTATIGYTITDNVGGTNSSVITVTVTNLPPTALGQTVALTENTARGISLAGSDPTGLPLTFVIVSGPANGTLTAINTNSGAVTYTPNTNYLGSDAFTFRVNNGYSSSSAATVNLTITNIPPVANPDSYAVSENSANTLNPLLNDVLRTPGGSLTVIGVSPKNGTATISGTNVVFTPAINFTGTATISYTITDGIGGTNSSLITVTITNLPPLANPDSYTVAENSGTNVLSPLINDVLRTPGGTLALLSVNATNGTAVVSGTNVLFVPATNFFGTATIGYTITDSVGGTNSSLITVNVTNVPPVANAQSVSTTENTAKIITLTGTDPNHLPLTFAIVGSPANGTLSLLNTNTGTVTYTPGTNFAGADSFTFRVSNGQTNSAAATVSLTVVPVADLVVVQSGPTNGLAGSNLVFTVSVTNRGPATASSLVISNQLAAGFTFVSASGAGVNSGGLVTWLVASLPLNSVTNFTVTAFASEGGAFTNIASGGSAVLDLYPANNDGSLVAAQSLTVITPVADVAVFKDGGTNVYAGQTVAYVITATNAGPSTATNVVVQDTLPAGAIFQSANGSYAISNGIVTWSSVTLAPNAVATFNLTLLAPASVSSFLNIASATSPTLDPNPTNNNGSLSKSRVATTVTPSADLIVLLSGPATAIQGSNFVYSLLVTNTGPSAASNIVVSDSFPSNLVFVSASAGGGFTNNVITWPKILSLAVGATTNYTITARGLTAGIFTNLASALAATYDPNPTNNTGVSPASQVQTTVGPAQFGFLVGAPVFNPQTGLFEEVVTVTNTGTVTVPAFRLYVGGLRSGVSLYNAIGTNNGLPYTQYNFAVNPTNSVSLILEFYNPSRLAFTNNVSAEVIFPPNLGTNGTNGSVLINRIFPDNRFVPARIVIEFNSVPGKIYTILYSTNLTATVWKVATPTVTANANVTQWYDDGPPKTDSLPGSARYYRIIQN